MKSKLTLISLLLTITLLIPIRKVNNGAAVAHSFDYNIEKYALYESTTSATNDIVVDNIPEVAPAGEYLAKAGLLYDVKKKKICWEKELKTPMPIASLTKMMVALITVEDIKANRMNWNTTLKVTKEACRMGGSKVFLRPHESFTVKDLMKSAMIASGNDACYLLAQANAGSEAAFVKRMNKRAGELGMKSTHYSNCTGLPTRNNIDNYSTSYDLLLLANELLKHTEIIDIASRPQESIKHGKKQFYYKNHNKLVIQYEDEVDGLKTGFTLKAGYCIVVTANRGNRRLVSIVLGAHTWAQRNNVAAELMNNYYSTIGLGKLGESLN